MFLERKHAVFRARRIKAADHPESAVEVPSKSLLPNLSDEPH
jgi:hypothetical protein